jgi:hypothetical protein
VNVSRADELRAELALLELEDEFVAAKASGEVTREQKAALREARRAFREQRSGGAVASPDVIETKAVVAESGG